MFFSVNLHSACHHVCPKPKEVPQTAFTKPICLFEHTVMRFGLTNAPAIAQSVTEDVLEDALGKSVFLHLVAFHLLLYL